MTVVELLLILLKEIPFWVSFVEQVRVAIWKLSLVVGMRPAWWKDFPVCLSFSSTSAYEPGRVKYVLASSVFFISTCRNRRGTCSGTACLKQKGLHDMGSSEKFEHYFSKAWGQQYIFYLKDINTFHIQQGCPSIDQKWQ